MPKKSHPNIRAIKIWNSMCPSYFPLVFCDALFSNLTPYFNIYMSAEIVNEIVKERNLTPLITLILITVIGNFVISIGKSLIGHEMGHSITILNQKEAALLNNKTLSLDYEDLEKTEVRQLRRKIVESAKINWHGKESLLNSVTDIAYNVINIIFAVYLFAEMYVRIIAVELNYITVLFLVGFVLLIIVNIWMDFHVKNKVAKISNDISQVMIEENRIDDAMDTYNMGKDVRLYRQDKLIMNINNYAFDLHKKAFKKFCSKRFMYEIPLSVLSFSLQLLTYIFVCFYALKEVFGIGNIIKYIGFIQRLINSIINMFDLVGNVKYNTPFIEDYLAYFDIEQKMCKGTRHVEKKMFCDSSCSDYEIEFRDVSFKYPASDSYALRHVSLKFHTGERLAVVGMNGSGKTTFIKLLCRLYDPTEGEILLNGMNIKEYDYDEYMSIFSVVFQDFKLFSFTLGQNVSTSADYDKGKVEWCLTEAGFGDRMRKMPDGIETCLYKDFDEKGVEISGGEAQKIAIARALYKNSPFIILDEPTAALDPVAEAEIYSKFNEIVGNKTAIYISHRLSSCRFCDEIVVFDNGQIVQQGNHNVLVADESGKYYELWYAQAQYYK